ncbi:DUF4350 domain-containing protein [Kribbella sp. NBC_01245]|uniref:DUF4350 domain-containing protein n=1 Tax=Kribbella sp. NBC_01245 TaxID=2903578 RepID=UPI002E290143|nr:DUF4350 domain-containing protein [Kribbella sp. NBC_01245]
MSATVEQTSLERTGGEIWRSLRKPLLITVVIVVGVMVLLIANGARTTGPFSPDSAKPTGARALATLLEDHGVNVNPTAELSDAVVNGSGRTLLVAPGGAVDRDDWQRIANAGWDHLVLVQPSRAALEVLAPGVTNTNRLSEDSRAPRCDLPAATKAGTATISGTAYSAPADAIGCYGDGIHHSMVRLEVSSRTVDVLGSPRSFDNQGLATDGNAAFALNLIGTNQELVWYVPGFDSYQGPDDTEGDDPVVPVETRYVAWMLAFAIGVLALWRGRRLGPVVAEPLPVIVHAAETTEGRARLYRRSRARDRAADALRESALGKLRRAHGIGRRTDPHAVVATIAARTGRDPVALNYLLYGPPPPDDATLLALSRELDVLTQEVRRP